MTCFCSLCSCRADAGWTIPAKPSVPAATPPRKFRRDSRCSSEPQAYVHCFMTRPPKKRTTTDYTDDTDLSPTRQRGTQRTSLARRAHSAFLYPCHPCNPWLHSLVIESKLHRRQQRPQVLLQRGGAVLARRLQIVSQLLAFLRRGMARQDAQIHLLRHSI